METVGAFEARTHLDELLDRVERGEFVTIIRHGKPAAQLVRTFPPQNATAPMLSATCLILVKGGSLRA